MLACGFDSGGVGSGGSVSIGNDDTTAMSGSEAGPMTAESSDEASSASAMTTMAETTTAAETTSNSDPTTDPDATTAAEAGSSDGTGGGMPVHVQHGDHGTCDTPLWCYLGVVSVPVGGMHAGQECFLAPIDAPFEIASIDYDVGGVSPELTSFLVEVHAMASGEPAQLLAQIPLLAGDATVGHHVILPPEPIVVTATRFCVGFRTTEQGLPGALGFAVDTGSSLAGASFVYSADCSVAQWTDSIVDIAAMPSGNWCIGASLVPLD